jgi:branched-chain amino acid transport system ATP-binding protein
MTAQMLEVKNVSKRFGGLLALDAINFDLAAGELVCLIGPNGAGKTTLFNVLSGQLAPTGGTVTFEGTDVSRETPSARARRGFGRTFQISQTLTSLSVIENAMIGAFLKRGHLGQAAEKASQTLALVGLSGKEGQLAGKLTLGERRRLEVARALALEPKIVLLDEVMAGLNHTEINVLLELVQRLHADGYTFIVIEHNLKVVRQLSPRTIVLNQGRMLAEGSAEDVLNSPAVIEAYIGKRRA